VYFLPYSDEIDRINRFEEISEEHPMSDLLWSDPSDSRADSFVYNKLRCCSYYYSPIQSEAFLKNN
jgi:diadenosine tetraphosphatase ApaH/serine/threonine PP2A family protein phosphatase